MVSSWVCVNVCKESSGGSLPVFARWTSIYQGHSQPKVCFDIKQMKKLLQLPETDMANSTRSVRLFFFVEADILNHSENPDKVG